MGDWSILSEGLSPETIGASTAVTWYEYCQSSAVANTKGSWRQLVASTSKPATGIALLFWIETESDYLVDIGIGGAGAEVVIIPNIYVPVKSYVSRHIFNLHVPIAIPAGVRIAARCQDAVGSGYANLGGALISKGFMPSEALNRATTYGAITATSLGTAVAPSATAHTKGAWVEISSAITNSIRQFVLVISNVYTGATSFALIDIGIGAAGSEKVILANLWMSMSAYHTHPLSYGPFDISIPAGTRLAARGQWGNASGPNFLITLTGID
jgi:hypothetical protein